MAGNPHRGDVEITLVTDDGERTFVMRPTFEAMVEIEQSTGHSLIGLARRVAMVDLSLTEAAWIVTAGLKAGGEPASFKKVGPMVFRTGLAGLTKPLVAFLDNALNGGEPPGEFKATEPA